MSVISPPKNFTFDDDKNYVIPGYGTFKSSDFLKTEEMVTIDHESTSDQKFIPPFTVGRTGSAYCQDPGGHLWLKELFYHDQHGPRFKIPAGSLVEWGRGVVIENPAGVDRKEPGPIHKLAGYIVDTPHITDETRGRFELPSTTINDEAGVITYRMEGLATNIKEFKFIFWRDTYNYCDMKLVREGGCYVVPEGSIVKWLDQTNPKKIQLVGVYDERQTVTGPYAATSYSQDWKLIIGKALGSSRANNPNFGKNWTVPLSAFWVPDPATNQELFQYPINVSHLLQDDADRTPILQKIRFAPIITPDVPDPNKGIGERVPGGPGSQEAEGPEGAYDDQSEGTGIPSWIWIVLGIGAIGLIGYLVYRSRSAAR